MKDINITAYYCPSCGRGYDSKTLCPTCNLKLKLSGIGIILAGIIVYALSLILLYKLNIKGAQYFGILCLVAGLVNGIIRFFERIGAKKKGANT
jgi:hypothetical protein